MPSLTLGQKIRYFRKRVQMSQMQLELKIDAAFGSISRIEHDLINPTKETMFAIARALDLDCYEIVFLFGIEFQIAYVGNLTNFKDREAKIY